MGTDYESEGQRLDSSLGAPEMTRLRAPL